MADEAECKEIAAEGTGYGVDPAAASIALIGAGREEANAFLKKQSILVDLQAKELAHELRLRHWSLQLRHASAILKLALEVSVALIAIALASVIGAALWNAANSDGLVIEAFSVPPDLAARGLTGEVVASQLLGNLSLMQTQTGSARTASSYTNNWGDDIKVEIPETGVSIGEFNRFLQQWLGHETHISGAVYRTAAGITVTARVGNDMVPASTGSDADLDELLQKTSQAIYRITQPYRYGEYLVANNRLSDAETALSALVANGSREDRFWANIGLAIIYGGQFDFEKAITASRRAIALRPDSFQANSARARVEYPAQHDEAQLTALEAAIAAKRDPDMNEQAWVTERVLSECQAADLHGDYQSAIALCRRVEQLPDVGGVHAVAQLYQMSGFAAMHDAADVHDAYAAPTPSDNPNVLAAKAGFEALTELRMGHWSAGLAKRALLERGIPHSFLLPLRAVQPAIAYGLALSGDLAGAHAEIDKTPSDCSLCLRMHGRIDALEKNWGGATYWFARAVKDAPSTPFPYAEWGRMLLDKGDYDGAIAKFTLASQKGPHFADPLEGWGEALMAKNRSDLALTKFEEANKYAPNWGRLHLKWGEALFYAGKKEEARKQFAQAAALDLAAMEKVELAGINRG